MLANDHFVGLVYRAHDPNWAWDPLSGEGARRNGGRFNKRGTPALYTSLTIVGALNEATPFGLQLQPTTICAYQVHVKPVFDATDPSRLTAKGMSFDDLACPTWRSESIAGKISASQTLADRLIQDGYAGILVRSFAYRASESDLNLVLWQYGSELPTRVTLVDDDHRLSNLLGSPAGLPGKGR